MKNQSVSRYAIPKRALFSRLENEIPGLGKRKIRAYELIELLWVRFGVPAYDVFDVSWFSCIIKCKDGTTMVLYNVDLPLGELAFVIAHELGHLLLGHDLNNLSFKDEYDAAVFAYLCRIPNDLLEKIQRGLGFLTGGILFYFLGNSQMRPEVARTVYDIRVTLFLSFQQKRHNEAQLLAAA